MSALLMNSVASIFRGKLRASVGRSRLFDSSEVEKPGNIVIVDPLAASVNRPCGEC